MISNMKKGLRLTNILSLIGATILFFDSPTLWASLIIVYLIYIFWTIFKFFFDDVRYAPNKEITQLKNKRKLSVINWQLAIVVLVLVSLCASYVYGIESIKESSYIFAFVCLTLSFVSLLLGRIILTQKLGELA